MRTEYTINGYVVGKIWMPATECWKELNYTFVRSEEERAHPWQDARDDLRDAMLHVTNDGDFQSCRVCHGQLTVRKISETGARKIVTERIFDLAKFKSVADMVRDDWEGPHDDEN